VRSLLPKKQREIRAFVTRGGGFFATGAILALLAGALRAPPCVDVICWVPVAVAAVILAVAGLAALVRNAVHGTDRLTAAARVLIVAMLAAVATGHLAGWARVTLPSVELRLFAPQHADVLPSPDGSSVVVCDWGPVDFSSGEDGLTCADQGYFWLVDHHRGRVRWVDFGGQPSWSPDGKSIAYASDCWFRWLWWLRRPDGVCRLWVYSVRTGNYRCFPVPRVSGTASVRPETPRWSPDSRHVLLAASVWQQSPSDAAEEAWIVSLQTRAVKRLPVQGKSVRAAGWSRDGLAAHVRTDNGFLRLDTQTLAAAQLGPPEAAKGFLAMVNDTVLFSRERDGPTVYAVLDGRRGDVKDIVVPNARGRGRPALWLWPGSLSPEGTQAAGVLRGDDGTPPRLVVIDLGTMRCRGFEYPAGSASPRGALANGGLGDAVGTAPLGDVRWSPDGSRLALIRGWAPDRLRLLTVAAASGEVLSTVDVSALGFGFVYDHPWLDDQHHGLISFDYEDRGSLGLWAVRTDGTDLRRVFPPQPKRRP
jgi:hypothetical protein